MSKFNGKKLKIEIIGESHSKEIKGIVKGLKPIKLDYEKLYSFLSRRKANGESYSTPRTEKDIPYFYKVKNGLVKNKLIFTIKNENINAEDYSLLYGIPRPSHADYTSYLKDGTLDFSGGGRFSGRLTLPLCVIGGICIQYLENLGIKICSYIASVGSIKATSYKDCTLSYDDIIEKRQGFPSLSNKEELLKEIENAKNDGDSVGAKIECIIYNLKGGIGDNLFSGLEGKISSLLYAIPAVKGVEFGLGFDFASKNGSEVNDGLRYYNEKIEFLSNNNGGILGGISSGEPITIGIAIKPTPSIEKEQESVDLINKQNVKIKIKGRHDCCIAIRALPVIESAVAIAIYDELVK